MEEDVKQIELFGLGVGLTVVFFFILLSIGDYFMPRVTKTCYVTQWKWEKSSNGVRVRVPKAQVCVKGEGQ